MCSIDSQGAKSILAHYNWSYSKALMHVFPDIGLNEVDFATVPRMYTIGIGRSQRAGKKEDINRIQTITGTIYKIGVYR
jgi:hypothetical protein